MQLIPYTDGKAKEWDAFVAQSRNGTFFHTRRFLGYHAPDCFKDTSLLFMDDNNICATLSAASIEDDGKRWLVAHPGASYGGLALSPKCGMKEAGEVLKLLTAHAREAGFHGIRFLRLTPPSVRRMSSDDQEYWLFQDGWRLFRVELATSLFLGDGKRVMVSSSNHARLPGVSPIRRAQGDTLEVQTDVLDLFTGKCRNAVRQGERGGLVVRESKDFRTFWPILEGMLEARHAAKPTHSLAEIEKLAELCPGDIRLFGAFDGGKMVGGTVGIVLHDKAIYTLYMAQDYAYQERRPMHLIIAELARICIREGRNVLHFGISTEDGGKVVNDNLFFFKESFGGRSVRRESWEVIL